MTIGDLETARCCGANFMLFAGNYAASGYVEMTQRAMQAGKYRSCAMIEMSCWRWAMRTRLTERDTPTVVDVTDVARGRL
jgi:hypothetical protein